MAAAPATEAKSRTRRSSLPRCAACRGRGSDLVGAVRGQADAEDTRAAIDDLFQLGLGVKVQPDRNAEAVAQRIGQSRRGRGADQREFRKIDLHQARRRPGADNEVELKILHRRIKDFLDRRIEPVNFVDEKHVALFEIGEQRREIAGLGDHRPAVARKSTQSSRATICASVVCQARAARRTARDRALLCVRARRR